MTVDMQRVLEVFPPRSNYYGYVSNSNYMSPASYKRELKRLRSRDQFRLYGEAYPNMFEAARQMGFIILEMPESNKDKYSIYMLLKKRDAQKYMKQFMEEETQEKQEPVQFDVKDLWSTQTA